MHEQIWTLRPTHLSSAVHPLLLPNCTQHSNSSADQCNSCRPLPWLTWWSMASTDVRPTSESRCQANLGRDSLGHVLPLRLNCTQHSNSSADQCNSCRPLPQLTWWSMTSTDVRPTSESRCQANLGRDSPAMCYCFGRTVHNIVTLQPINVTPVDHFLGSPGGP